MDLSSKYTSLSDMLRRARETLDSVTPGSNGAVAGAMDPLTSNLLYPMIMQSAQGDVLNRHKPRQFASPLPASPTPQVTQGGALQAPTPSPPISTSNYTPPQAPPQAPPGNNIPWWANAQAANFGKTPAPASPSVPAASASPQVPMPMARPPQAPQPDPQMSFAQRNTAMMRDPSTGDFIDPQAAAKAQAQMQGGNGNMIASMLALLQGNKQS